MDGIRGQLRRALNARTYVLAAALALVLLWVGSTGGPRRAGRPGTQPAVAGATAAPGTTAPATAAVPRRAGYGSIEPDWGPDPFARRFPGGN